MLCDISEIKYDFTVNATHKSAKGLLNLSESIISLPSSGLVMAYWKLLLPVSTKELPNYKWNLSFARGSRSFPIALPSSSLATRARNLL
jgi:hypothetical protein